MKDSSHTFVGLIVFGNKPAMLQYSFNTLITSIVLHDLITIVMSGCAIIEPQKAAIT